MQVLVMMVDVGRKVKGSNWFFLVSVSAQLSVSALTVLVQWQERHPTHSSSGARNGRNPKANWISQFHLENERYWWTQTALWIVMSLWLCAFYVQDQLRFIWYDVLRVHLLVQWTHYRELLLLKLKSSVRA